MIKTIKALINKKCEIKLLESVKVKKEKKAIVTFLDDDIDFDKLDNNKMAELSIKSLEEDWNSEADSRWDKVSKYRGFLKGINTDVKRENDRKIK